jgi:glycerate-2-kinase
MPLELNKMRQQAIAIFMSGIDATNPYLAVKNFLINNADDNLEIKLNSKISSQTRTKTWNRIQLLAFGKAACPMTKAAQEIIPAHLLIEPVIVVTNYENITTGNNFNIFAAGHPLPDATGLKAAKKIAEQAQKAQQDELVLVLISGGGSSLIPYPVDNITLEQKIITTELLLGSGATINEINCIRKHLSKLKGGGLTKMAAPADLHALILSDVIGDDVSTIASGPTVPDETTFLETIKICKSRQIWHKLPDDIRNRLNEGASGKLPETPKKNDPVFDQTSYSLIGSNALSIQAIESAAIKQEWNTLIYSRKLCGEARDEAKKLALYTKNIFEEGVDRPIAILAGGETTVTLNGKGRGGRNQELALAFSIAAKQLNIPDSWVFLSGGTDGRDGPTDAAGGIVDPGTCQRIRKAKLDPNICLANNDSYTALKAAGDLLGINATGTNVADLQVLLIRPLS